MSMIYLAQNEYHKYQQILLHTHDELDKLNSKKLMKALAQN